MIGVSGTRMGRAVCAGAGLAFPWPQEWEVGVSLWMFSSGSPQSLSLTENNNNKYAETRLSFKINSTTFKN